MSDPSSALCLQVDAAKADTEPAMFVVNSRLDDVHNKSSSELVHETPVKSKPARMSVASMKSASAGSSPNKSMRDCMFQFPVPNPRTWTILWEPATATSSCAKNTTRKQRQTDQAAGDGSKFYTNVPVRADDDGTSAEETTRNSFHSSPTRRRRQKIFLNGKCIDNIPLKQWRKRKDLCEESPSMTTIYTFVTDKLVPPDEMNSTDQASSHPSPTQKLHCQGLEGSWQMPQVAVSASTGKELTFHQLAFNSKTLKPYDHAVFTVSGKRKRYASESDLKRRMTRRDYWTPRIDNDLPPSSRKQQLGCKLVEAAKMLLELSCPE